MFAESVDVAEHSSTLDSAMDGGLSHRSRPTLRRTRHHAQIHLLNTCEKCRQTARVILAGLQLDRRELPLHDRAPVDAPRAVIGNGVSDQQEMA